MPGLKEALQYREFGKFKSLLPKGQDRLPMKETSELLEMVVSRQMPLKWAKLIAEHGTLSGRAVYKAIIYDYPVTPFLKRGKRITYEMLSASLDAKGKFNSLKSLLEAGGNVNAGKGKLLKKAVEKRNYVAVQLLLHYGADPTAISKRQRKKLENQILKGDEPEAAATWMALDGATSPVPLKFK